jgi:lysophospholipase L1-like esterase
LLGFGHGGKVKVETGKRKGKIRDKAGRSRYARGMHARSSSAPCFTPRAVSRGLGSILLGFALVATSLGAPELAPAPVIKSANDPTKPVPGGVRWFGRMHNDYVAQCKNNKFDLVFLGDSITQMWPRDHFNANFGKFNVVNFGIGGDRAENVLWRMENGELQDTAQKLTVLLIGTNNQGMNTAEEVAIGVTAVVRKLQSNCPQTKILLLGIFPSAGTPLEKTKTANAIIAKLDDGKKVRYLDAGAKFLDPEGKIMPGILSDSVHLQKKGYEIWAEAIMPLVTEMMAAPAAP